MTENQNSMNASLPTGSGGAFADWEPSSKEIRDMIEVAAYYIAKRSDFKMNSWDCWVAAEAQISTMLSLKESQKKLQSIIDSALDAVIVIDASGVIVKWNPQATKTFGWEENEIIGKAIESTIIPPRYRAAHSQGMSRFLATGEGPYLNKLIETQALHRNGSEMDIELTITPIKSGNKIEICAFIRDITARKRAENIQAARIRLMEFASTHTLNELLVATLDEIDALTGSPVGFYHFLEADESTLSMQVWSTRTINEFCKAEDEGRHYDVDKAGVWKECIQVRGPVIHNDYASLPSRKGLPRGHVQVVREMVIPVFRKGNIVAILGVGNKPTPYVDSDVEAVSLLADLAWDLVENKRMEAELRDLATTDFLTKLSNRRHFLIKLEEEFERLKRSGAFVASVLMLDLDHFKRINDTFGHATGDLMLKHFAENIRGELRKIDTVGRLGGEEFAILLPGADVAAARVFAERIRQKVAETPLAKDGDTIPMTVSIGIASMKKEDADFDATLIRADNALYRAKENGRNRVEAALL